MITTAKIGLKEYFAAIGSGYSDADAKVIGPELEKLAEQGKSCPRQIVEAATNAKSPIHPYFEWRDDIAAQLYREDQARGMAQSIMIKVADSRGIEREVRAFHSARVITVDTTEKKKGPKQHPYLTFDQIKEDKEIADSVIYEALRQLITWKSKYALYREVFADFQRFDAVFTEIDSLEKQVSTD